MAHVQIDFDMLGLDTPYKVTVFAGASEPKVKRFANRDEAEAFAERKMGRKGSIVSTLYMSPEQLAAHRAREARAQAFLRGLA